MWSVSSRAFFCGNNDSFWNSEIFSFQLAASCFRSMLWAKRANLRLLGGEMLLVLKWICAQRNGPGAIFWQISVKLLRVLRVEPLFQVLPTTQNKTQASLGSFLGSLWTKCCAPTKHTVWGFSYIKYIYTQVYGPESWELWKQFEPQFKTSYHKNFHTCTYMSSNRYVSKLYEQSSEWVKLMTIYSTAQPIEAISVLD